jgi:hypothetical protein
MNQICLRPSEPEMSFHVTWKPIWFFFFFKFSIPVFLVSAHISENDVRTLKSSFSPIFTQNKNSPFWRWEPDWKPVWEPSDPVRTAQHWSLCQVNFPFVPAREVLPHNVLKVLELWNSIRAWKATGSQSGEGQYVTFCSSKSSVTTWMSLKFWNSIGAWKATGSQSGEGQHE